MNDFTVKYLVPFISSWFLIACDRQDPTFGNESVTTSKPVTSNDSRNANAKVNSSANSGIDTKSAGVNSNLPITIVDPGYADPSKDSATTIDQLARLPKVGMLVNNIECGLCHVDVKGDVVSTREVTPPRSDSESHVTGRWLASDNFDAARWVTADKGIFPNYVGKELPLDTNNDGRPDFPAIDFASLPAKVRGKVTAGNVSIDKVSSTNTVLIGTQAQPIVISSDVYIMGDLVLSGFYQGNGTIYASGNIYLPGDLKAMRTAFPYPNDPSSALARANQLVKSQNTDSLGIATAKSILIADLESTIYAHSSTPANRTAAALGVRDVYSWYPNGKTGYDMLYIDSIGCHDSRPHAGFNMIEAFMYAKNSVAGISRDASFTIRGGVIADYLHIISGALNCPSTISPAHGMPQNRSYIEYDYRMQTGMLKILENVAAAFPK